MISSIQDRDRAGFKNKEEIVKWEEGEFWIVDETKAVDMDFVAAALPTAYWAEGRPRQIIEKSIHHSVVLSLFHQKRQIGLTRIVSDLSTFAWICDVYVHPDYRGKGLGKWLIRCTLKHPSTRVKVVILATRDAHGLYEKFNFVRSECMRINNE